MAKKRRLVDTIREAQCTNVSALANKYSKLTISRLSEEVIKASRGIEHSLVVDLDIDVSFQGARLAVNDVKKWARSEGLNIVVTKLPVNDYTNRYKFRLSW